MTVRRCGTEVLEPISGSFRGDAPDATARDLRATMSHRGPAPPRELPRAGGPLGLAIEVRLLGVLEAADGGAVLEVRGTKQRASRYSGPTGVHVGVALPVASANVDWFGRSAAM